MPDSELDTLITNESKVLEWLLDILEKYEVPQDTINRAAVVLADSTKRFAAQYHALYIAGKIPDNRKLMVDDEAANKVYKEILNG
ncbi:MAG TPA: hypothetical protein VII94_01375 [Candidatus Saccharimonadales bacterium]